MTRAKIDYQAEARRVMAARSTLVRAARASPAVFCQLVLKDEETGCPIKLAPMHVAWHRLMSEHRNVLLWAHVESGKSQLASIGRTLWEIGKNPNKRFMIISDTKTQAAKIVASLKNYIEHSEELRTVFPGLVRGRTWGEYRFSVERTTTAKDPTVQAAGVFGNITGSRCDGVVLDDILDQENTRTKEARDKTWNWIKGTLEGRLTREAWIRVVGTAYHPQDALHRYARQASFEAVRYPVIDDDRSSPTFDEIRWPERWDRERIDQKRIDLGEIEFSRQMMCLARDDSTARFKREWIYRCLEAGDGKRLASHMNTVPPGYRIITGVDLAVSQKDSADLTCLFTIAVTPQGRRRVLNIESGRWAGPEIVQRIFDIHRRFNSIVIVENNAAQDFILQFARSRGSIPIRPFTTTAAAKHHVEFGVESIAAEMSAGAWEIPNIGGSTNPEQADLHPEVAEWIDEMLYYDPRGHTGDRLMACWMAREGVRMGSIKAEVGRLDLMKR